MGMSMEAIKYQDYKDYRCIWLISGQFGHRVESFLNGCTYVYCSSALPGRIYSLALAITTQIYY